MDTKETVTDGISSTTTGSEAMITDEGARTDRYIIIIINEENKVLAGN